VNLIVVNEAIARAKEVVVELFGAEGILDLNLEEVAFNKRKGEWLVAISFLRPVNSSQTGSLGIALASVRPRNKKLIRLDAKEGEFIAVTDVFGSIGIQAA
jgi:hypothetical protein